MSANIVLTGLMGGGKSSVGKLLAKKISRYIFVDLDEVIVDLENMTIPEIFDKKGEPYFRELESQLIEEFSQEEGIILALGGGAFESEKNRDNLMETSCVIYLKASPETLYKRVKSDKNRPLLFCNNPKEKLKELLNQREPNYLKANYIIETDNKTPDEIADEISNLINLD